MHRPGGLMAATALLGVALAIPLPADAASGQLPLAASGHLPTARPLAMGDGVVRALATGDRGLPGPVATSRRAPFLARGRVRPGRSLQ